MGRIEVLPPVVRSRIAAGEVVENPAAIVKELAENALDAAATRIQVELLEGGRKRIRVGDDGAGIHPDDMPLSVEHFATSKIRSAEEVFGLRTYGFRGEALASIAAVSLLTILSRRRELNEGVELRVLENGKKRIRPASCAPGTSATVENLFYQVPARRKFLKSNRAETARVSEVLARLAISQPRVAFLLRSGERVLMDLPRQEPLERVRALLGDEVADSMQPFRAEYPGMVGAEGFIAPPSISRPNRTGIYVSVGRRPLWDATLIQTVLLGYQGLLPDRRFPIAVIDLNFAPLQVDINVHPQKREVRLSSADTVRNFIRREINAALLGKRPPADGEAPPEQAAARAPEAERETPSPDAPEAKKDAPVRSELPLTSPEPQERFDLWHGAMKLDLPQSPTPQTKRKPPESAPQPAASAPPKAEPSVEKAPPPGDKVEPPRDKAAPAPQAQPAGDGPAPAPQAQPAGDGPAPAPQAQPAGDKPAPAPQAQPAGDKPAPAPQAQPAGDEPAPAPHFRFLGQLEKGYLVFEAAGLVRVIDPHALHERILYEGLLSRKGPDWSRRLLFPTIVSLSQAEAAYKDALLEALNDIGFDAREMGRLEVGVDAVPGPVYGLNIELVVREVLAETMEESRAAKALPKRLRAKLLETIACRAAVKLGKHFSEEEAVAFFRQAANLRNVQTCPHGRPTSVDINVADIERKLSRR